MKEQLMSYYIFHGNTFKKTCSTLEYHVNSTLICFFMLTLRV